MANHKRLNFLSVKELADRLRVSPSTIYAWVEMGFIPHFRLRKRVIFELSEIQKWLEELHHQGRKTRLPYTNVLPKGFRGL